jgi:hypothetical protein
MRYMKLYYLCGFCDNIDKDATQLLEKVNRYDVIVFLHWILDNYLSREEIRIR